MSKQILLKDAANKKLLEGLNLLCDGVQVTLGPKGKCVIMNIRNPQGVREISISKDGVTVAQTIESDDVVVNTAIQTLKQASIQLDVLGDGTTTVTVWTRAILSKAYSLIYKERVQFLDEINKVFEALVEKILLKNNPVTLENIGLIAKTSANNDGEVAKLFEEAYTAAGLQGYISIENSLTDKSHVQVIKGYAADMQLFDNRFANSKATNSFIAPKAHLLLYNKEFVDMDEFRELLNDISKTDCPLIIVAKDFNREIQNKCAGLDGKVALVRNQLRNEENQAILDDLVAISGAEIATSYNGIDTEFGTLYDVELKKGFIIISKLPDITSYVNELKNALELNTNTGEKEFLSKRITRMERGLITMYIGAKSELERNELRDRVNDAFGATKNSISLGYILGGGQKLLKFADGIILSKDYAFGTEILNILATPLKQMLLNADFPEGKVDEIINKIYKKDTYYNILTEEFQTEEQFQIYDPVVIVNTALETAVSIATTFAQTETLIVED